MISLVGLGYRIHRLHLCRGVKPSLSNECPGYNINPSDDVSPALEFCGIYSTPSLPSLPGSLWPGVVAPDRVLPMDQIGMFDI